VKRSGQSQRSCRYIVSQNAAMVPHQEGLRVFAFVPDAMAALRRDHAAHDPGSMPERVEICCVTGAEQASGKMGRPCYRFYYDTHLLGATGDGSERDPWPDVATAIDELEKRHAEGQLTLRAGQMLTLERREIFTATSLERRKMLTERIAAFVFMAMSLALVVPLVSILAYLAIQAGPALSWEFLTQNPENRMTAGGIWAPLVGTFFLVLVSLLVAAPIGIMAGIYLNEYARDNVFTRLVNLAVVNLAGVPSIVHALFGVGAFVLAAQMGKSMLAASCTLAVMTLPVIITSTREALASVPMAFREACWNMGASRWQTIRTIVLPNSIAGILTGIILQVSRAAGETAPILFTGATIYKRVANEGWEAYVPYGIWDTVMALSMHLFTLMTQINNAPSNIVYGTAVVLIGMVLAVNSAAIALRVVLRSRKKW
jgi:phosphate transport system permease protein